MSSQNLIFDVGMHKGEDTDFYLRKGYSVVGFEADPELIEHCHIRFRDALKTGRLTIVAGAVAPKSAGRRVTFFRSNQSVWGTVDRNWVERNRKLGARSTEVTVDRVDMIEAFHTYGIPFFIKIDIEGSDFHVLETLSSLVTKPRFLSIESEKIKFEKLLAEIELLKSLGYTRFKAVQQQTIPSSNITTKTIEGRDFKHKFENDSSGVFGDEIQSPWLTEKEIIEAYKKIFDLYERFGDQSPFNLLPIAEKRKVAQQWAALTGYQGPFPGWYDTHATY